MLKKRRNKGTSKRQMKAGDKMKNIVKRKEVRKERKKEKVTKIINN